MKRVYRTRELAQGAETGRWYVVIEIARIAIVAPGEVRKAAEAVREAVRDGEESLSASSRAFFASEIAEDVFDGAFGGKTGVPDRWSLRELGRSLLGDPVGREAKARVELERDAREPTIPTSLRSDASRGIEPITEDPPRSWGAGRARYRKAELGWETEMESARATREREASIEREIGWEL